MGEGGLKLNYGVGWGIDVILLNIEWEATSYIDV